MTQHSNSLRDTARSAALACRTVTFDESTPDRVFERIPAAKAAATSAQYARGGCYSAAIALNTRFIVRKGGIGE
jgi:hypothetical protein